MFADYSYTHFRLASNTRLLAMRTNQQAIEQTKQYKQNTTHILRHAGTRTHTHTHTHARTHAHKHARTHARTQTKTAKE